MSNKVPVFNAADEVIAMTEGDLQNKRIDGKTYYLHHIVVEGEARLAHYSALRTMPTAREIVEKAYKGEAMKIADTVLKKAVDSMFTDLFADIFKKTPARETQPLLKPDPTNIAIINANGRVIAWHKAGHAGVAADGRLLAIEKEVTHDGVAYRPYITYDLLSMAVTDVVYAPDSLSQSEAEDAYKVYRKNHKTLAEQENADSDKGEPVALHDVEAAEQKTINKISRADVNTFLGLINNQPKNALDLYQQIAGQSAFYPGKGTPLGLNYVALKMNGEAGEFAEHVGKAMRDDSLIKMSEDHRYPTQEVYFNDLTPERREKLIKEIGDELWYLAAACGELGISLSDAAYINLDKLASRTEAGTLKGSGDDR